MLLHTLLDGTAQGGETQALLCGRRADPSKDRDGQKVRKGSGKCRYARLLTGHGKKPTGKTAGLSRKSVRASDVNTLGPLMQKNPFQTLPHVLSDGMDQWEEQQEVMPGRRTEGHLSDGNGREVRR
jgi:hypothetical protein